MNRVRLPIPILVIAVLLISTAVAVAASAVTLRVTGQVRTANRNTGGHRHTDCQCPPKEKAEMNAPDLIIFDADDTLCDRDAGALLPGVMKWFHVYHSAPVRRKPAIAITTSTWRGKTHMVKVQERDI
jgi:hypothetical protein